MPDSHGMTHVAVWVYLRLPQPVVVLAWPWHIGYRRPSCGQPARFTHEMYVHVPMRAARNIHARNVCSRAPEHVSF